MQACQCISSERDFADILPRDANEALGAMAQLLAKLYRFPIDEELGEQLAQMDPNDSDDLFMRQDECRRGIAQQQGYFSDTKREDALRAASNDFHKLFVGPTALRAVPWSSVYVDSSAVLFGPTAQAVRGEFERHGLVIPEGQKEPSDHIAYELQFLAEMHWRANSLWGEDEHPSPEALKALEDARSFKEKFLDIWSGTFLEKVEQGSRVDVYRGVASLTRGYLALEGEWLAGLFE